MSKLDRLRTGKVSPAGQSTARVHLLTWSQTLGEDLPTTRAFWASLGCVPEFLISQTTLLQYRGWEFDFVTTRTHSSAFGFLLPSASILFSESLLDQTGGIVSGVDRPVHEALLLCKVFTCEINAIMVCPQHLTDGKPLTRTIECVRSLRILIFLPGIPFYGYRRRVLARKKSGQICSNQSAQVFRAT